MSDKGSINMKLKLLIILCFIIPAVLTFGQDPHFSQYYASPATVNPAMTGKFQGSSRISGVYRQQWAQYGDPFATGTITYETKTGNSRMEEGISSLALGGFMLYDKTPGGIIKSQYFQGLISYHQVLDKNGFHKLGIGFMAGLAQKSLDLTNVSFGSQFTTNGFNLALPNMEPFNGRSMSNFDIQGGLLYSYNDNEREFYLGTSLYHINEPKNYFYDKNTIQQNIPRRYAINAGANIVTEYLHLATSALYMRQGNINYILVGASVGMPFNETGVLYTGLWYRVGEAFIPQLNLQFNNTNIGLSYEAFINPKTFVKPRSLEISISWRSIFEQPSKLNCYLF